MKKLLLLFCIGLFHTISYGQEKNQKIHFEIINQIWKPFKKSFDTKNAKTFNSLHTNDILRINSWGIKHGEVYKKGIIKSYNRTSSRTRRIEFWLEQSVFSDNIAHQIGYYAVTYKERGKKDFTTYAQFQVTLKKEHSRWKIWQDFDTELVGGKKVDATFVKELKKLNL